MISCRHGTSEITHYTGMRTVLAVHIRYLRNGWNDIGLIGHLGTGRGAGLLPFPGG